MGHLAPQVDAYIAQSPEYARPILKKLRKLFHQASPQIEETLKWGHPTFEYKGIVAGMAAFKKYVTLHFWKGAIMRDPHGLFDEQNQASLRAMSPTEVSDLPADAILLEYFREAVDLNERNVKVPKPPKKSKPPLKVPAYFAAVLRRNKKALATFAAFSPSHQREYIEWITQAKQEETRNRRLKTAIEWLSEGKTHNWRYERKSQ